MHKGNRYPEQIYTSGLSQERISEIEAILDADDAATPIPAVTALFNEIWPEHADVWERLTAADLDGLIARFTEPVSGCAA